MAKKKNENQVQTNVPYLSEKNKPAVLAKPAELTLPTTDDNSAAAVGIETSLPELNNIQPVVNESTLKQPSAPSLLKQKAQKSRDKRNAKTVIPVTTKSEPEKSSANVNWGDVIYNKMGVTPEVGVKSSVNLSDVMKDKLDGKSTSFLTTKGPTTSTNVYAGNPNSNISTNISAGAQIPTGSTTVIEEAKVKTPETTEKKEEAKLSPWEEMLKERRKTLIQDKTDAAKMQKYYALTDALKALGDMGGTALGSAIGGGKAFDNATPVAEYKPSRGYLDAFEKAKNANEALRKLDDTEFQLAYSKAQRDEERAYNEKVRDEERKYRAELIRLESELRQAEKAGDREAEEKFRLKVLELTQAHEEKLKRMSVDIVNTQMAGKTKDVQEDTIPFTFKNLTKIDIPKNLYPEMLNWALTLGEIGEDTIDEDNVETVLRKNPELVNSFLNLYGYGTKPETTSAEIEVSDIPAISSNQSKGDIESVQNISIMHDSPTVARRMDSRNQKIAQKQAEKNSRVQELMDAGYTEQEAKRQVRVEKRIAKAAGKFGFNGTDGAGVTRVNEPVIVTDEDGIEWE